MEKNFKNHGATTKQNKNNIYKNTQFYVQKIDLTIK